MPGYDAFEPGYTGNANDAAHVHRPYVRHVRTDWHRDEHGLWDSETWDENSWEVVCAACGDDEGPANEQTVAVRGLRGPYPSRHKAQHAAHHHEREANPRVRWGPGSAVPQPGAPL